jgi:carboxylesterase type B
LFQLSVTNVRVRPICPQVKTGCVEEDLVGSSPSQSSQQNFKHDELECLNLNVTCPGGLTPDSRIPVMTWIHGGKDRGSGSSWIYDGGALVYKSLQIGKPVIVVTLK